MEDRGVTERQIQHALARHFNWVQLTCVPNAYIGGGEMDMAVVTRAGYLGEVEIKLTVSDWNADRAKGKWQFERDRQKVSRFWYAVPEGLLAKVPAWVPPTCGLIGARWLEGEKRAWCIEHRPAVKTGKVKLTDGEQMYLLGKTYHRFWQRELRAA